MKGEYEKFEALRAIVFGGDAPSQTFEMLRTIVSDVLPGQVGLIRDTIDPLYVGAIGAAEWAKLQVQNPSILANIITVSPEDGRHDEL
jgi:hypothetical protein